MNPGASEWKPSVNASAWTPGQTFQVSTPTLTPAPPPPPAQPTLAEANTNDAEMGTSDQGGSGLDENDPLWQAVLKIANGDRAKAERMLNDPDQLAAYPEITELLAATGDAAGHDDWEQQADNSDDADQALAHVAQEKMTLTDDEFPPSDQMDTTTTDDNKNISSPDPVEETDGVEIGETGATTAAAPGVAAKEGDPREHINLVFIGHVDAGKSTLCGNILYLTDNVDKRSIERYEKEAKERNRDSWFLAFIMDTNEEERAKGITVEVGKARFETAVKRYTILDAPGHKNYVPNMIQGASQADIGILVISARKGEFETGFDRGGQTREHAMLAKTLGVSYLIVVVNKMDEPTVQWRKERFDECVMKIRPFLKSCGFIIKKEVKFIPVSGLGGANVKEEVSLSECKWWKEYYSKGENNTTSPTLFHLLDNLEIQGRDASAPLRIPVLDRYSDRGIVVMGKVESGVIRPGDKVMIMPTRTKYKVDEVYADETPIAAARPGENVLFKLSGAKMEDVRKGYVVCALNNPCRAVDKIICQIAIMDMPENQKIMTAGFNCVFHAHTCEEECTVVKIFETTNAKGQIVKGARFAGVQMRAVVMIELNQTAPLECFDDYPFLGRFTLRTEGKTIAIGKVTKLPPKKE